MKKSEAQMTAQQRRIMDRAAVEVRAERRRQVYEKKYLPERDDAHEQGELVRAACAYALAYAKREDDLWPWPLRPLRPRGTRRNLVIAAALLLAEIERLDRAEQQEPSLPLGQQHG